MMTFATMAADCNGRAQVPNAGSSKENTVGNNQKTEICPVCGYPYLKEGPYDEFGCSTYEICPCCGFEFGYDDDSQHYSYDSYREMWINKGAPWFDDDDEYKPNPWNEAALRQQLSNLRFFKTN